MEKHRPYKTLLDIKRAHGLDPSSAIANELRQLVLIYNESYQKYAVISHTQANIITHKVKHDSFSKSLNNTILNLQALICNDCFPSSNVEHSHLATTHHTVPTTPLEKRKGSADQAILYQQYTREKRPNRFNPIKPHKKQIRKAKKGWEQLIRETLLLDLYGTYLTETGEIESSPWQLHTAAALDFINDVLRHFTSSMQMPKMRLRPSISPLSRSAFRTIAKRYRELSS